MRAYPGSGLKGGGQAYPGKKGFDAIFCYAVKGAQLVHCFAFGQSMLADHDCACRCLLAQLNCEVSKPTHKWS